MIDSKIVKIASFTKNAGLKNDFTHRSSIKNSLCGDFIKTEFIVHDSKVKSMRYETESCILCEASASLFSSEHNFAWELNSVQPRGSNATSGCSRSTCLNQLVP